MAVVITHYTPSQMYEQEWGWGERKYAPDKWYWTERLTDRQTGFDHYNVPAVWGLNDLTK